MIELDKHTKLLQFLGAALAIPVAAAGAYSVYSKYMSGGVSCTDLRGSIIAVMDRNITPDAKRTLLKEDVANFDKHCADKDPEARVVFDAAVAQSSTSQSTAQQPAGPQPAQDSSGVQTASVTAQAAIFGLSKSGEARGWVALVRHDADKNIEPNFDGFPISPTSLPAPGTVLTVKHFMPVWLEPYQGPNDPTKLQGRMAAGSCVKVLSTRPNTGRLWAEVVPEACK